MDDAATIARRVRRGETSALEETRAALQRADRASALNAFTSLDPDRALQRARAVDAAIAAGDEAGPLCGVPIALKDIVDQEGVVTTAGSSFLRDPASHTAPVVERLEAAGAIVIGRTGLHEFAYGFSSENDWWGPVRNPWDPSTSPGGSSGGSASAVAAGIVPVGIGTDTGGSVRVPAALCGLVGLKVTHGRIPLTGVFPLAASLDTVGAITRTIGDAAAAYRAMAGHHPPDTWSRPRPVADQTEVSLNTLTIGIPHPWTDRPLDGVQDRGYAHACDALRAQGATLIDLEMPSIGWHAVTPSHYHEVAEVHRDWYAEDPTRYGPAIRTRLAAVLDLSPADIRAAAKSRRLMRDGFAAAYRECDLLITPTVAALHKTIGVDEVDAGDGPEPYRRALSWFTPPVNQAELPAIALPIETPSVDDLPPSVQLIGPPWSESLLLGTGSALETARVVAHRAPPRVDREPR